MKDIIYDVAVIGGGIIGCNIFSDLSRNGYNTLLLEKQLDVGTGCTKANSALIHAGFDARPGTKKAIFNVEGNTMFPDICARLGVKLKKCGAFVVGDDKNMLTDLLERGRKNGVKNLKIFENEQLKTFLPNLTENITCGLFAENAYIIDPFLYTICLAEEGVVNGGRLQLGVDIKSIEKLRDCFKICDSKKTYFAKKIINSTGAGYNEIARLLGAETYNIEFRRGEYYVLDHSEKDIVPCTVFPLPTKTGKGVLVTPTVEGNILVGPTSYESDKSVKTTSFGLNDIRLKVSNMLDNVNLSKTIRVYAGVRNIVGEDFVVEKSKKVDGVINIVGICSPGLSSAPAISKYVIKDLLNLEFNNTSKAKKISPYIKLSDLDDVEQNKLIKKNSDYGKIVCKCEGVSVGEIKDALNRPVPAFTMDGVKRRVRAGMGRCQGGFCADKVALLIAERYNISLDNVVKEYRSGFYTAGDIGKGGKR